jgi:hypothetical protein
MTQNTSSAKVAKCVGLIFAGIIYFLDQPAPDAAVRQFEDNLRWGWIS